MLQQQNVLRNASSRNLYAVVETAGRAKEIISVNRVIALLLSILEGAELQLEKCLQFSGLERDVSKKRR